jgi:hypothetical protein
MPIVSFDQVIGIEGSVGKKCPKYQSTVDAVKKTVLHSSPSGRDDSRILPGITNFLVFNEA